jgi:hypothetical protein
MPQLLPDGLPEAPGRSRFDFSRWTDGQAWQFSRGEDYETSTESFRYAARRWAKANGFVAETRPLPATGEDGLPAPISKAEPVGLAVRFVATTGRRKRRKRRSGSAQGDGEAAAEPGSARSRGPINVDAG